MIDIAQADKLRDEDLAALTLKEQDYFLFIINRYKTKLFNYIRRITNIPAEDAEDLLQEIFLKIYLNLNDFDSTLKFSSWAYSIARNQVISNHRKMKARAEGYKVPMDDEAVNNIISDFNIEKDIDQEYLRKNISAVLDRLEEKYKEVLVLKFLEEKSYEEISDIIKKPIGTVGSLMNKAKQEFKTELMKQNLKF